MECSIYISTNIYILLWHSPTAIAHWWAEIALARLQGSAEAQEQAQLSVGYAHCGDRLEGGLKKWQLPVTALGRQPETTPTQKRLLPVSQSLGSISTGSCLPGRCFSASRLVSGSPLLWTICFSIWYFCTGFHIKCVVWEPFISRFLFPTVLQFSWTYSLLSQLYGSFTLCSSSSFQVPFLGNYSKYSCINRCA